jgi:hypothetical protein
VPSYADMVDALEPVNSSSSSSDADQAISLPLPASPSSYFCQQPCRLWYGMMPKSESSRANARVSYSQSAPSSSGALPKSRYGQGARKQRQLTHRAVRVAVRRHARAREGWTERAEKGLHTLGGMPVTREQIRVARAEIIRVKHTTFYTIAFGRGLGPMLVMSLSSSRRRCTWPLGPFRWVAGALLFVIAIFVSSFPQYGFQGAFSGSASGGFSFDGIHVSAPTSAPFIQWSGTTVVFPTPRMPHCFPCPSTGTCVPPWAYCPSETSHA